MKAFSLFTGALLLHVLGQCVEGGRQLRTVGGSLFESGQFPGMGFQFDDFTFPSFQNNDFQIDFPFPSFPRFFGTPSPSPSPSPSPPPPAIITPLPTASPLPEQVLAEFQKNRKKWRRSNVDYYSFTIQRSCFCAPESVAAVDVSVCGNAATEPPFYEDINTIDKVFQFLDDELSGPLASITIEYDPVYGFPKQFFIDREAYLADEEIGYSITNFQVLTQNSCTI